MTWPNYSPSCRKAVDELLRKGGSLSAYRANKDFGAGPTEGSYARKLEREIEKRFKVKHAVAVNSGTAGLHCALVGAGITSGEVLVSPFTFSASVAAILHAGATPVFSDVDPFTYTITPETCKRLVNKCTRAILPVDIFGGLAPVKAFRDRWGLPVIEDACQAVGAVAAGAAAGSLATAAAMSMNGGKNIPAGECGMMVTQDGKIADRARLLMNHGENFGESEVGYNYRPNELTCCVAYHGLLELDERNKRRQELAATFYGMPERRDHVYYCTPFICPIPDRKKFIRRMRERGVHVGGGYISPPLHHYPAFRKYCKRPLPTVDALSFQKLCLIYDFTPNKPVSYAAEVRKKVLEAGDGI